jgi:hypothetical protein
LPQKVGNEAGDLVREEKMDARRIYLNGRAIFGGSEGDGGPKGE